MLLEITAQGPELVRCVKRYRSFLLPLLVVIAGAGSAHATDPFAGTRLEEVLNEIDARQKNMKSMEAEFTQTKEMSLLAEAEVSTGTFAYQQPNRVIWEYETPTKVSMLISDGEMTTWYPELGRAEKIEVKQFEDRIFRYLAAGTGALRELTAYFDVRFIERKGSDDWIVELDPNSNLVRRRVQKITIWIDKEDYVTNAFEWIEGDGDLTRYEFRNIVFNPDLDRERFTLAIPAGTRVDVIRQ